MLTSFLLLLFFGCLTGATTVLFGFGGGFVTVPVVYAVTDGPEAMHVAVATSAAVMIVNASLATVTHARSGALRWEYLRPWVGWIAIGAAVGATAAGAVPDRMLRLFFAAYLVIAIADIVLRNGFLTTTGRASLPSTVGSMASGLGIGAVAAFLGVGGSVLTVPLLRRKGLPMVQATASANPLSLPVAVVASIVYRGSIDLTAAAGLLAGALPTIALVERSLYRVPDRVHAIAYPAFLAVVLVGMLAAVSPW